MNFGRIQTCRDSSSLFSCGLTLQTSAPAVVRVSYRPVNLDQHDEVIPPTIDRIQREAADICA